MADGKGNTNPRVLAMRSLLSTERDGKYANLEVSSILDRSRMSDADRGLYTALVYGVIERTVTLDEIISQYAKRPLASLDAEVRCALRLGLYQLLYMNKIPPHAAVSESVELVGGPARGFVNAALRSFLRAGMKFDLPAEEDTVRYLSVKYSCPEGLCALWLDQYGRETAEQLLASSLDRSHVSVRVNTLRTSPERLADALRAAGETAEPSPLSDDMLRLFSAKVVVSDFAADCFVEDEASRLAVCLLGARPGELVVDTCAAPGGKSFSLALDMENKGRVCSFDLHANKLSLVRRGAERLGISIIETEARDAREPREDLVGKADRVLCDAPCSGFGVIAKKPDVKYRPIEQAMALPAVQLAVLRGAAAYVKSGGRLVYSTCTLNRAENEDVVRAFLAERDDFALAVPEIDLGGCRITDGAMVTFLPHETGTDGFFAALLERRRDAE